MRSRPEITVRVVKRGDRGRFVLRWQNHQTGESGQVTSEARRRRDAEREAVDLLQELETATETVSWQDYCQTYQGEGLASTAENTRKHWRKVRNHINRLLQPVSLGEMNAAAISKLKAQWHREGLRPTSVRSYLRALKAALRWAHTHVDGFSAPTIAIPPEGDNPMKGRPISTEEFERILTAVRPVMRRRLAGKRKRQVDPARLEDCVESWTDFLWGLWLSSLRLNECLHLSWDDPQYICVVGLDTRLPKLRIPQKRQKSRRRQLYNMAPDFAEFLRDMLGTQEGFVFSPQLIYRETRSLETVSEVIRTMGRRAKVIVDTPEDGKIKYASAHDLRRSFAERWRGTPGVDREHLTGLMRHRDYKTTDRYYLDDQTDRLAGDVLRAYQIAQPARPWRAGGDQIGDHAVLMEVTEET